MAKKMVVHLAEYLDASSVEPKDIDLAESKVALWAARKELLLAVMTALHLVEQWVDKRE